MIVVIGGGYAGGSIAWALARRGQGARVTVVEAEPSAGAHASGRNAGLIGSMLEEDPHVAEMAARGARLLRDGFGGRRALFTGCGSIRLLAGEAEGTQMAQRARALGVRLELHPTADLARDLPLLAGAASPVSARLPDDGRIDPVSLARAYLAAAEEGGVRVLRGARVMGTVSRGGRLTGVAATTGVLEAEWVVDAAGAWAGAVAAGAGLPDLGLTPCRRHLYRTFPLPGCDPGWPWVWDVPGNVYFKPEGDRLLLCPCDEEPHPAAAPMADPQVERDLRRRLPDAFPALASVEIETAHVCLRTFAPDRRYVIGPDPRLPGFFWAAGLGGSGATAGAAIGELAADLLIGRAGSADGLVRAFDPVRLAVRPAGSQP